MAVFVERWRSFGARSRNSEREESIGGGEARPVERRRRALLGLAPRELEDEEEREQKPETTLGRDKLERVSVERRDGRRVGGLAAGHSRRYGRRASTVEHMGEQ